MCVKSFCWRWKETERVEGGDLFDVFCDVCNVSLRLASRLSMGVDGSIRKDKGPSEKEIGTYLSLLLAMERHGET